MNIPLAAPCGDGWDIPPAVVRALVALDDLPMQEAFAFLDQLEVSAALIASGMGSPRPDFVQIFGEGPVDRRAVRSVVLHCKTVLHTTTRFDLGELPAPYRRRVAAEGRYPPEPEPPNECWTEY